MMEAMVQVGVVEKHMTRHGVKKNKALLEPFFRESNDFLSQQTRKSLKKQQQTKLNNSRDRRKTTWTV